MRIRNQGIDIIKAIGGITSTTAAVQVFERRLDSRQLSRILQIAQPEVLLNIANAIVMCAPEQVFINTGTPDDRQIIREMALANGEERPLKMENHTIHFDLKEEQGRIIDRTYYVINPGETTNSLARTIERTQALEEIRQAMSGIMKGKSMIVGFYIRGPIGSPVSNPALEITSSAYVCHCAELLYRNGFSVFDHEVQARGYFYTNIHSEGRNLAEDLPQARVFMDRSYQTTFSYHNTYAGNSLMLKKGNHRFSVDRAIYEHRGQELAEHMFITGIKGPGDRETFFVGAAPSGCGKTTTAMTGTHLIGDDLAQLWIDTAGSVRSINPEFGIFGILEDVNQAGDPLLMHNLRTPGEEVIWSNVLVDEGGIPHWTGNGEQTPVTGINFQGLWKSGQVDENGKAVPVSHPNARFTLKLSALANYCEKSQDACGVETKVVTYSGRDSDTNPPVWVAKDTDHGVVIGACIVSAATATEVGASGIKRNPWANALFIPGALGDYMDAQFKFFGNPAIQEQNRPIIAGLNYFLTDKARGGTSPNLLGEKRDVKVWLSWLERRVHREVEAIESPIGYLPRYEDLKSLFKRILNKPYPETLYQKQFSLYVDNILARIALQYKAYRNEWGIPERFFEILKEQEQGLLGLRDKFGVIVSPDNLLQTQGFGG